MEELKTGQNTFSKDERLCSKIIIDKLFAEGKTVYYYPLRFVYLSFENQEEKYPIKVIFSVPKRSFKKAVDRNLIRRRIREAYRLEKNSFYEPFIRNKKNIALMVIYTNKDIIDYQSIKKSLQKGMKKLINKAI